MRRAAILLVVVGLAAAAAGPSRAGVPELDWFEGELGQVLHVHGMTFVASEGSSNEIVLRSERTLFYPERQVADLERVDIEVAPGDGRTGFRMNCDEGRLNLATHAFVAEGNVVGTIEGGRDFEAAWVAYDERAGVLYTNDPVLITDEGGRYRGGGFRYFVEERRFRLEGGATVVQEP